VQLTGDLVEKTMIKVLFVCMGNICRSPTAEGVFRQRVREAGLEQRIMIDSAGTHDYHIGKPPDRRAQAAAAGRGYDLSGLRGRQVEKRDFEEFDYILAMDTENLVNLNRIKPPQHKARVGLFSEYGQHSGAREVPDPYYGGDQGFEQVLDMVETAAAGLLAEITRDG
jgi:protein-tyrosine phosphatase